MTYTFTKEAGNLLPFAQKTSGKLEDLPQPLQPVLRRLVSDPVSNQPATTTTPISPDADNYTMHVEDQGKQWSFRFRDLAIPNDIAPLIDHLRQKLK